MLLDGGDIGKTKFSLAGPDVGKVNTMPSGPITSVGLLLLVTKKVSPIANIKLKITIILTRLLIVLKNSIYHYIPSCFKVSTAFFAFDDSELGICKSITTRNGLAEGVLT